MLSVVNRPIWGDLQPIIYTDSILYFELPLLWDSIELTVKMLYYGGNETEY
jgi:hypothetical protein